MSAAGWGHSARWVVPVLVASYLLAAIVCCALAATGQAHFVDLHVYRMGGDAVLRGDAALPSQAAASGGGLYSLRFAGLPFTYPPFAAVVFTALAAVPWTVAAAAVTAGSAAALIVLLYLALRLPPVSSWLDSRTAWRLALAVAVAAIWLEPVRTALGYGQIDLFLALGVLYDVALPDAARHKGAVIGIAAGIKLTPAIFAVYLLATRRYRAAAMAAAAFAATIAAGFAVLPASSARYWGAIFLNPRHVAPVQDAENQSLLGALARTMHTASVGFVWLPLALGTAALGLAVAARAHRTGNEALGFSACAVTGLLVSPISWTHHWVIAIPALLLAAVPVCRRHPADGVSGKVTGAVAVAAAAVLGWTRVARAAPGTGWLHLPAFGLARSLVYVVAGLVGLGFAAAAVTRRAPRPPGSTSSTGETCRTEGLLAANHP
ncbi:MAG TPA: glycosyltransferase 87 family protein [Streptosporangiaceae bacterium]|nr:glycosyltransferase 87 family protein [Streptosporangiaceae bacterium]